MKVREEKIFGIARKIVANMTSESWETIPHGLCSYEADVTSLMPVIKEMNEGKEKKDKVSINTVMLKIICEGIKAAPVVNSHMEFNRKLVRGKLTVFDNVDISMPATLPSGEMMTINMHNMENKSLSEMSDAIKTSLKKAAKTDMNEAMFEVSMDNTLQGLKKGKLIQALLRLYGSKMPGKHRVQTLKGAAKKAYYSIPKSERLTKTDIEQGTITVSNLGSVYREGKGRCYFLEIIPPQTTAVALMSIRKEATVVSDGDGNDKIEIRQILPMTFAFDHRAYDYGDVVPMFRRFDEIFAKPEIVKEWV